MIRFMANGIVSGMALVSLVTSGWSCRIMPSPALAPNEPVAVSAHDTSGHDMSADEMSGHDMSAMPGNSMRDCQGDDTGKSTTPPPCAALCAVTMTAAPAIVHVFAAPIGAPYHAPLPAFRSWSIQPEPYPPRA